MSTTAVTQTPNTKPAAGPVTLRSLISSPAYQARFKEVLGEKAQQFCTSIINVGNTMQDVEPNSIIQSAMIAAALDLPVDKNLGFAWIVPYKKGGEKYAQFQMGFKGYIQLGLRTGQYKRMNARAINAEAFGGYDEVGEPVIDWSKVDESKPVVGYVFAFSLVNGFAKVAYWPKSRVEEHAKRYSQSFRGGYESPWKTHFDEMALKTVIKNELARWGILSIQMQEAMSKDQAVIDVEGKVTYVDNEPAASFTSPKPLLTPKEPAPALTGNSDQAIDATPTSSVPAEETPWQALGRIMGESKVSFDDFRDYCKISFGAKDTDSWDSYSAIPQKVMDKLTPKAVADCIKKFGQLTHQPTA